MMYYHYPYFFDGFGGLFVITLFFFAIIWLIGAIVRGARWRGHWRNYHSYDEQGPHNLTTPLDTLKDRYAKGDITKEQFDQMKKDLGY